MTQPFDYLQTITEIIDDGCIAEAGRIFPATLRDLNATKQRKKNESRLKTYHG